MRIRSNGQRKPSQLLRLFQRGLSASGRKIQVNVQAEGSQYSFVCTNPQTLRRATTLLIKEPGTIRWLRAQSKPGRVFLDIGANVGIYSIFAGHHVGDDGHVYSVEPHLRNAAALMENVMANHLEDRVSVLCMALSREPSVVDFHYREWGTGSSHSQLQNGDAITQSTAAVAKELKAATAVDLLIDQGSIRRPDFVKIDVDGIELAILEGATQMLRGEDRPGSVQVECEPSNYVEITEFMADHGYDLVERHATMAGQKKLARGVDIKDLPHNVVYEPKT